MYVVAAEYLTQEGKDKEVIDIPIISEEESRKKKPDYYLVLPWHFMAEFKKRESDFLKRGGKFLLPMPTVHLVGKD